MMFSNTHLLQMTVAACLAAMPCLGVGTETSAQPVNDGDEAEVNVADEAPLLRLKEHEVTLSVPDVEGAALTDFLKSAQVILGQPISFSPDEVRDIRMFFIGSLVCARDDFRDFFDHILRQYGLLSFDAALPGSDYIVVKRPFRSDFVQRSLPTQFIDAADLDQRPARRTALYETSFLLQHIDARHMMANLTPMTVFAHETIRSVPGCNALVVSMSSVEQLRRVRDMLAVLDVARPD
jgi:type II secretory pathway component GspD/PulD (secretin)